MALRRKRHLFTRSTNSDDLVRGKRRGAALFGGECLSREPRVASLPSLPEPCPTLLYPTLPYPPLYTTHPSTLPAPLPYPALPYPTLPCPTLPYPTLPYPTVPYPTLPYRTLPYPTLPYPVLSYPTLPYPYPTPFYPTHLTPPPLDHCETAHRIGDGVVVIHTIRVGVVVFLPHDICIIAVEVSQVFRDWLPRIREPSLRSYRVPNVSGYTRTCRERTRGRGWVGGVRGAGGVGGEWGEAGGGRRAHSLCR